VVVFGRDGVHGARSDGVVVLDQIAVVVQLLLDGSFLLSSVDRVGGEIVHG
jgi:hypothetical protein